MSQYEENSKKFREAWDMGRKNAEIAHIALNDMIRSLRKDNPKWSIERITQKIASDHQDLKGFSPRQIQRELDQENRALIQNKGSTRVGTKNPNKDTDKPYYEEAKPEAEYDDKFEKQLEKDVPVTAVVDLKRGVEHSVAKGAMEDDIPEEMQAIAEKNSLDVVVVGRYGLFDAKKTAEVLQRDLGKLKSSGWKIVEISARHIS